MLKSGILLVIFAVSFSGQICTQAGVSEGKAISEREFGTLLQKIKNPFHSGAEREESVRQLRQLGTNALPFLVKEIKRLDQFGYPEPPQATELKLSLWAAFQVLDSIAEPLLPSLLDDLRNGRSLGVVGYAIASIGGEQAGLGLVQGLTNSNPQVRATAVTAIVDFKDNNVVKQAAASPLINLLNDESEVLRTMAANSLGILQPKAELALPALIVKAENDTPVVRIIALKAIGRFGKDAMSLKDKLEVIVNKEKDQEVKKMAEKTLKQIE